ncbi:MAG: DUF2924 domain-containing protein [Evtepia sp.]
MESEMTKRKINDIEAMDMPELRDTFRREFGFENRTPNSETIRRRLQYRVQENAFGGLTDEELATLDRVAEKDAQTPKKDTRRILRIAVPGTRLIREYQGQTYEVTIGPDGTFIFNGRTYKSLSGIAREITGVHWNGKRFFGVR